MTDIARIREGRARAGLSLTQAAEMSGVAVAAVEEGLEEPTEEHLGALATTYGVTACWLRGHDPHPPGLEALLRQADVQGVGAEDRGEVEAFVKAMATCRQCLAVEVARLRAWAAEQLTEDGERSTSSASLPDFDWSPQECGCGPVPPAGQRDV